ncbi:proline-rich family protein [Zea mays]|uniref:Proline-rich family protein n=1 Tax=Zea mays TaxID=4577 RepID=A0A1D6MUI4_MAIZE|nr:proline-rich family protein [Zea mays]
MCFLQNQRMMNSLCSLICRKLRRTTSYWNRQSEKLRYFPEVKLGVNIPAHGESHELLNTDGDKNDYEWLLTPPETPLFRSLDDEENQSITQVSRGRAQSKPIQISRSSMVDNNQRASRSSASSSRLSPSPCSMGRTRSSSSASRSSPPLAETQTPSRRLSTPPIAKTLTPPRRSPSPVSRRMSTGSSGPTLNGTRGASPVKSNHRSSSPKLHGWQSNVPGFSFDAPLNLRTSLTDRPVCRSRGGSPSSFSGLEKGSRGRRLSMSPTPPRRASSSHSIERDRMSSYSKASATSSGEDDLESMQSVPISYSSSPVVKKSLVVMKTRTIASSKNLSKKLTPSSVPKRSFDSALWLMDHRKAPQDRFRPLLSGAPANTFGAGNGNDVHKPMFSHNSSLTTSSTASSYHGATFGSYMHGSQEQHDFAGEWEADDISQGHEDIFMFDKLDELNEDIHYKSMESTDNSLVIVKHLVSGRQDLEGSRRPNQSLCHSTDISHVSFKATCSRCGKFFDAMDVDEEGVYCDACATKDGNILTSPIVQTIGEENQQYGKTANLKPCIASDSPVPTDCEIYSKEVSLDHQLVNNESYADCLDQAPPIHSMGHTPQEMLLGQEENIDAEHRNKHVGDSLGNTNDNSFHRSSVDECEQTEPTSVGQDLFIIDQMNNHNRGLSQCNENVSESVTCDNSHQLGSTTYQNPKLETTEDTGISVLLVPKPNSNKWPNMLCSEPYYARDGVSMMKRSFGLGSSSAASSSDLGSSRQSIICFERLRSGKKGDFEKSQISSTISCQSIASVSDMSICSSSASLCPQSDAVGDSCFPIDTLESGTSGTLISSQENDDAFCKDTLPSAMECPSSSQFIADDDSPGDMKIQSYLSEVGYTTVENHSACRMTDMDCTSTNMYSLDTEMPSDTLESSGPVESSMPETEEDAYTISQCNKGSAPEHSSDENNFDNIQMQSEIVQGSAEENRLDDCCMSAISEEDVLISGQEDDIRNLPNDEELCAEVEGPRKQIQRCFTLEEAADTILFCSSIVHDLAYKAATIALENKKEPKFVDSIRPTVAIVRGSFAKEESLPKLPHRRTPNRKVKRKRLEGETTTTETTEKDVVANDSPPVCSASGITRNSDNMKPPKLESKCNCIIM